MLESVLLYCSFTPQIPYPFRSLEDLKCKLSSDCLLHVLDETLVCDDKDEVVSVRTKFFAHSLPGGQTDDLRWQRAWLFRDQEPVVSEDHQIGSAITDVVGHFIRATGEEDRLEVLALAREEIPDLFVQVCPHLTRIHLGSSLPNHLSQVWLGEETQRCFRAVIKVEGFEHEPSTCRLDEAGFYHRCAHRVSKPFRCDALCRIAVGKRVEKDRPGEIARDGNLARIVVPVELFGH